MTQQINLIDPSLLPPTRWLTARRLVAAWAVGAVLALSHLAWERHALRQALMADMEAAGDAPATPELILAEGEADLQHRIAQREALRRVLQRSGPTMSNGAALLSQVMAALPESMWLTQIDIAGAQSIRIAGGATDPAALASFADRLARISALRGVPIEAVRIEPHEAGVNGDASAVAHVAHHRFVLGSALAAGEDIR